MLATMPRPTPSIFNRSYVKLNFSAELSVANPNAFIADSNAMEGIQSVLSTEQLTLSNWDIL